MSLLGGTTAENKMPSGLTLKIPDGAQVLIVCDDDSDTEWLKTVLRKAGLASECAKSITAGCEAARSGRFQVVVSKPRLSDGSWRRLIETIEAALWAAYLKGAGPHPKTARSPNAA